MKKALCYNCLYWKNTKGDSGECRRFPKPAGDSFLANWPKTSAIDWCGEHKSKPKKEKDNEQTE